MEGVLHSAFEHPQFAADGESAMALAGERAFDVIFIDVGLQGIDGYAVCGMLRQIAMHHYTPVVLVTARADDSARADAQACGANDLISKPLLAAEVTLQALILALRYRLESLRGFNPIDVLRYKEYLQFVTDRDEPLRRPCEMLTGLDLAAGSHAVAAE